MKKILFLIFILIFLGWYGCKRASDSMYADCMSAGVQSEEQCEFEAYYR